MVQAVGESSQRDRERRVKLISHINKVLIGGQRQERAERRFDIVIMNDGCAVAWVCMYVC